MVLAGIAGIVVLIVVLLGWGHLRWEQATVRIQNRLTHPRRPQAPATYEAEELEGLPAPVAEYFRTVLTDGRPVVRSMEMQQAGTFNMGTAEDQWKPFTARQTARPGHPGFLWDARIKMLPVLPVRVHDAYVGGEGILHGALFGLVTVTEMRGTPEAARGELLRYLAEAPWYPTALLPSQGAQWEAVDESSARVRLTDGATTAEMLCRFNDAGLIESIYVEERGREVNGRTVPTPWEGRWWGYERHGGMLVPTEGEVAWILPERRKPYWRGHVEDISYEF